jgi:hypothetical protein
MAHNKHTESLSNQDLNLMMPNRQAWLDLAGDWEDPFEAPKLVDHNGFKVVREDLMGFGSKCRFGDILVQKAPSDTLVYVQPRYGFAGISLAYLAKKYNKKLVLFSPSQKEISDHQAICIERGADMKFRRIAAMPNLNKMAADWAAENDAFFIPLGLRHELVTAAAVKVAYDLAEKHGYPEEVWSAMSTGVLSRALQIAWPDAKFNGVAVARNIKAGERGRATMWSHPKPFNQDVDAQYLPPFPSATNYDAKAWEFMTKHGNPGAWFWNVGGDPKPEDQTLKGKVDSERAWGEIRDVNVKQLITNS